MILSKFLIGWDFNMNNITFECDTCDMSVHDGKLTADAYNVDADDIYENVLDEIGESKVASHMGIGLTHEFSSKEIVDEIGYELLAEFRVEEIIENYNEENLLNAIGWDTIKDHFKEELKLEMLGL